MFIKNCVEEQLILARDPSVQSLLLVDHFSTANNSRVFARIREVLEKTHYLMNTLYLSLGRVKLWRQNSCVINFARIVTFCQVEIS